MAELPTIAMLWVGGDLTWLEHLCAKSFVDGGHPIKLYTYEKVGNVPDGVEIVDGKTILEGRQFYRHDRSGSVAPFSDIFRFHLMKQAPRELWVDTDIYCWKPLDGEGDHVFGYEAPNRVNSAVLRMPPDSEALGRMLEFMDDEFPIPPFATPRQKKEYRDAAEAGEPVHISAMPWGLWGPLGLSHFLKETGEVKHAQPIEAFYPIHFRNRNVFLKRPALTLRGLSEGTKTIHLWSPIKRFCGAKFGGYVPENSFLHNLMTKHGIERESGRVMKYCLREFDHEEFDARKHRSDPVE